ncbi:NAD-P-binding protein [Mycena leptocephala]|nr:NAD-P-binding protein [Mycena leptocephala]
MARTLQHNATVYIAARDPKKVREAIDDLKSQTGKQAEFLELDLADLHSVKRAAQEFTHKETQLHVLFNNGTLLLNKLLLPTLLATAAPGQPARVINTSSMASEVFGEAINYDTLKDSLYYQSKFANVAFSNELSRLYADQGILSVALNPGNLKSGLQRHLVGMTRFLIISFLYIQFSAGIGTLSNAIRALTQLWAGTTDEGAKLGGKRTYSMARIGNNPSSDSTAEKALWTWLEEQVADI